jgi:sugar-phosphatase
MTFILADAILFDLDGVLIDSSACILRHWQVWAQKHDLNLAAIMQVAHGRMTVETMRLVAPHLDVEAEARRFEAAEAVDTDGIIAIEGAAELLKSLPPDGWTIVTSGSRTLATNRLICTGLPVPRFFITADDVKNGKPHPEPYLAGAIALGVSPAGCVVIEDAPAGIAAAHSAGMRTIAITTTHAPRDFSVEQVIIDHLSRLKIRAGENGYRLSIQIQ